MRQSMRLIIEERIFSKFVPGDLLSLLKFCSLILDRNTSNGDDMKMKGVLMAMMLLGTFGRYGIQPFCTLYKTDNDDNNNDNNKDDNDNNDNDNGNAEEADGVPMSYCMAYHTLMGSHFDSKLRFLVAGMTKDESGAMVMSMALVIPDGSRAPPVRLTMAMVLLFANSIA